MKCKYCGVGLPDPANIRCLSCDNAWQDGFTEGDRQLREKINETVTHLLRFAGLVK